jgi:hypothetical protein
MITREPRVRFFLTLDGVAGINTLHQLKHLLKILLRTSGLRCVEAREVDYRDDSGSERR